MKTTIDRINNPKNDYQETIIKYGASTIIISKSHNIAGLVTVSYELTKYILRKYQGDEENAIASILEGLTMRQIRRLLFDELAAQSVEPKTLNFKRLVYKIYKERKGNKIK
nr:MAG TPA: hypothetical protein [Caudoviricetes sp.]